MAIKKNNREIGSYSSIFEGFTIQFTIKSRTRDIPSFFSRSKIRIFPCFLDIVSKISLEFLGKQVWYFDEYWSSMDPLNTYRLGLLVAHTFLWVVWLENFFSRGTIFCLSYICAAEVHTKKFFFFKDVAIKKNNRQIGSDSSIFVGFTILFTIKSGSRDTSSFFSCSKIRIFTGF